MHVVGGGLTCDVTRIPECVDNLGHIHAALHERRLAVWGDVDIPQSRQVYLDAGKLVERDGVPMCTVDCKEW
jgi:hypothetical protein